MMKRTVILIPCYNESKTIADVVRDWKRTMPHADIYVYDNNSTDGTAELEAQAGAIVRHEYRQGKGNVVRAMFRDIEADCYIMVDGDNTYPASFGPVLEKEVLDGSADMAVGDRLSSTYFTENKRPFHNMGNVLVRRLINFLFHAKMNDIMTGARAFSWEFVKAYPVISKGFEIETEMTIFALDRNFKIVERPIEYQDRPAGSESKLNTYSDGIKVLKTIVNMFRTYRPFSFFTIVAAVFFLIGLGFFLPIFFDFVETGVVAKFPTLILVSSIFVIATLNFFCGVVLSVLQKQSKQTFEMQLTTMHLIRRCMYTKQDKQPVGKEDEGGI